MIRRILGNHKHDEDAFQQKEHEMLEHIAKISELIHRKEASLEQIEFLRELDLEATEALKESEGK